MKIRITKGNREIKIRFEGTVKGLLEKLKINPETVIVTRDNVMLTEDEKLSFEDEVVILSVVSGG